MIALRWHSVEVQSSIWTGVVPAITTPFNLDGSVDLDLLQRHAQWMLGHGCTGIVGLGSLGEGGSLSFAEKVAVLGALVEACGASPVIAGVAALSTDEAVEIARAAEKVGCRGLMVLPPYVYPGDKREITAHMEAVFGATGLSCMLYNNPIAYRIDFDPEWTAEFCRSQPTLHSIKESSADVRRLHALRSILGSRLELLVGVDDLILEGIQAGATGWIAGMVNACPKESVDLFNLAREGKTDEAVDLYHRFLPLLRLDVVPKFVQLIKLAQAEAGWGTPRVRAPRLELEGEELDAALRIIRTGLNWTPAA